MLAAGYARILQTSSVESQQSSPGHLPYAVSKWALMAMQEQWYSTHAAENVRARPALCWLALCHTHACMQVHRLCACLVNALLKYLWHCLYNVFLASDARVGK